MLNSICSKYYYTVKFKSFQVSKHIKYFYSVNLNLSWYILCEEINLKGQRLL